MNIGEIIESPNTFNYTQFAEHRRNSLIDIKEIEQVALSPQKVFSMNTEKVDSLLRSLWLPNLFELQNEGGGVYIQLTEEKTALDVVDAYIERL